MAAVLAIRTTVEAQSIGNGSFIRQAGTDDVYRVNIVNGKGYKWLILNETAFCSYGCPWGQVRDVSRSVMNQYGTSAYARRGSDSAVWYFTASGDTGTRHWLNMTPKEFEAAGLSWDAVHSITWTDFNQYSRGGDLTCLNYRGSCQPKVDIRSSSLTYDEGDRVSSRWVATVTDRDSALRSSNITVSNLPSSLTASFSPSNGRLTISGTLASGSAGTHRVTVRASDGRLSDEDTFRVRVRPRTNQPPQISGTSDRTWREGQRVSSLQVATVTDPDNTLRSSNVTISGLPSGLAKGSYRASDGRLTISGTLASGSAGTYTVRVTARDGTHTTSDTFRIRVPHPPVINIRSDLTYTEGDRVSSQRVATVSDQDTSLRNLRVPVTGLPSGLSGSFNTSNGHVTISGTLGTGLRRSYTATVSASDGTYTKRGTFRIYVTQPPLSCEVSNVTSSLSLREGQRVSSQRVATVSAACRSAPVSGLPSGLSGSFSSSNRQVTISGMPAAGSAGTYTATISANDGTRTTTATFRISVAADPEITSLVSPSVTAGQSVGSTRVATVRDSDTPLSSLNVRVTGLPSGLSHSFNTSNGHVTISGTAPSSQGVHAVTITASDGVGSDQKKLQVQVVQVTVEPEDPIGDGSFIRQSGTDDVYRVFIANGKRYKWLILNETAFCSYGCPWGQVHDVSRSVMNQYKTSNLGRHGSDSKVWRFTASGDSGTRRWLNLTPKQFEAAGFDWDAVHRLTTSDFNQYPTEGPVLTCSDFSVCGPTITLTASRHSVEAGAEVSSLRVATVSDPDTPLRNLTVTVSGLPSGLRWSFSSSSGRVTISGTAPSSAGTHTVSINASDGTNTASKTFQITVGPPPPGCQISGVTAPLLLREGQQVSSQRVATVSAACRSAPVSGLPSGLSGSFSSSNRQVTISGMPAAGSAGTYTATISANDGTRTTTATFQITVVGEKCVITGGPAMSLGVGQAASNAHLATVSGCDLRNAQVQVSISPNRSGLSGSFSRSNGRVTISGTPTAEGTYQAVVTATSSGRRVAPTVRTTVITVTGDPPPVVATRGNFMFERSEEVGSLWVATVTDNDPLPSGNVVLSGLPSGLSKADYNPRNGRLRIAGTVSQRALEQAYTVTISASDGASTTRRTFQITIGAGDCASLGALTAGEIERVRGEWTSDDPKDHPDDEQRYFDRCRFELTSRATVAIELSSDAVESSLTVAPTASPKHMLTNQHGSPDSPARASLTLSAGSYYIYAATLWEGDTGGYVLRATIAEPIGFESEVDEVTWQRGVDGTRELPEASGGSPPYTYSLRTQSGASAPEGMTFNPNTRTLTGAPLGEVGRHRITYRVTDAMGFEAEQTFQIKYEEVTCADDRHDRKEPLAPGETWNPRGAWTSTDCVTAASEFITDHIGHYRDIYSFQVSKAVEVTINLESDDVGTYIHLLDNSGQRVMLTDASGDGNDAQVIANLKRGETYWIRATTRELGAIGEYTLRVITSRLNLPLGHEEGCLPQGYDLGAIAGTEPESVGGRLEDGDCTSKHASIRLSGPNADLYKFSLTSRATVTIEISTPSEQLQVPVHRLLLAHSDGRVIGENAGFRIASLSRPATTTATLGLGEYWVEVATGSDDTLSYALEIEVTECSTTELDLAAKPHQEELPGRLTKDDCWSTPVEGASKWADMYTFHLAAPAYMEFTVETDDDDPPVSPDLQLYDVDSNDTDSSLYGEGGKQTDERWLRKAVSKGWLSAGTWRLEVTKKGDDEADYKLTVTRRMAVADKSTAGVIAAKYAPTLKFNKGEDYQPVPIQAMLHYSELKVDDSGKDDVLAAGAGLNKDGALLTIAVLRQHNDREKHYLDLNKDYRKKPSAADDQCHPTQCKKLVYAHVADIADAAAGTTGTIVQYWFFYLYNGTGTAGNHQGDWEGISLYFANVDATELRTADIAPDQVGFASHGGGFAATRQISDGTTSDANAACGRMDVYVAQNRHGNYPEKGKDDFYGHEGGAHRDVPGISGDQYHGNGEVWTPSTYAIRLIDTSEASWFHWPGKWGGGDLTKVAGKETGRYLVPRGPQFNSNRWFWHRPSEMVSRGWGEFTFDCSDEWTPAG